jgi:Protein of unknown function (DUF2971)
MDARNEALQLGGLASSPPPTLYHYTSGEALLSIISSNRIRASHIRYLNDTSEINWTLQTALSRLEARKAAIPSREYAESISQLMTAISSRQLSQDFVASFSENGDDLSQWRAYCPKGNGFSIGFAGAALQSGWVSDPAGGQPSFVSARLMKVEYLGKENLERFEQHLEAIFALAPMFDDLKADQPNITENDIIAAWISGIASSFKHESFKDEREWRMIMSKPHKPMPGLRFRAGTSVLIPYIEIELNRGLAFNPPVNYMIDRVVVGPTTDPGLSCDALTSLFLSLGHPEVQIESSAIPYRHW